MNTQEAVLAFSQSEKIKSGLIWISQVLEFLTGLPVPEKKGAERIIDAILSMILHEIRLAKKAIQDESWDDIEKCINRSAIMINSGVASESITHLTKALSHVTTIGSQAMTVLKEQSLI